MKDQLETKLRDFLTEKIKESKERDCLQLLPRRDIFRHRAQGEVYAYTATIWELWAICNNVDTGIEADYEA